MPALAPDAHISQPAPAQRATPSAPPPSQPPAQPASASTRTSVPAHLAVTALVAPPSKNANGEVATLTRADLTFESEDDERLSRQLRRSSKVPLLVGFSAVVALGALFVMSSNKTDEPPTDAVPATEKASPRAAAQPAEPPSAPPARVESPPAVRAESPPPPRMESPPAPHEVPSAPPSSQALQAKTATHPMTDDNAAGSRSHEPATLPHPAPRAAPPRPAPPPPKPAAPSRPSGAIVRDVPF
jgi:hypothetical protein